MIRRLALGVVLWSGRVVAVLWVLAVALLALGLYATVVKLILSP